VDVLESYRKAENNREIQEDYTIKAKQYLSEADNGSPKAMLELGVLYGSGLGVPKNYAEALRWFRLAADKGEGRAMHNIGYMYQNTLVQDRF
jgi:TPR repeat protein